MKTKQESAKLMADKMNQLMTWPSDQDVYHGLPRLSGDAARFLLALFTYRVRGGRSGPILMYDIVKEYDDIPAVLDELAECGLAVKDDIWHWHPALFDMMAPARPQQRQASSGDTNIIPFPTAP